MSIPLANKNKRTRCKTIQTPPPAKRRLAGDCSPGTTRRARLRWARSLSRRLTLLGGNLVRNARTDSQGVSARVYRDGVYGFASAAEASPQSAREALAAASGNARFLAAQQAAVLMPQSGLTPQRLAELLGGLERPALAAMAVRARALARPDAARHVADVCEQAARAP